MKTPNEIARQILDHPDREVLIARLVSGMSGEFGNTPEKTLTWISDDSEWRDVPKSTPGEASGSARYCDDPDHCTYSDCPTAFCDRKFANGTESPRPGAAGAQMQTCVRDVGIRHDLKSPNASPSATEAGQ